MEKLEQPEVAGPKDNVFFKINQDVPKALFDKTIETFKGMEDKFAEWLDCTNEDYYYIRSNNEQMDIVPFMNTTKYRIDYDELTGQRKLVAAVELK